MHSGNIKTSRRLKDTLKVLSDGKWHSTLEFYRATGSVATHSDIAGLRSNGYTVLQKYRGRTPKGNKISLYAMVSRPG